MYYRDLNAKLVNETHGRQLKVFSWPPDQKEDIERAVGLGLDLMLSNNPGYAVDIVRKLRDKP